MKRKVSADFILTMNGSVLENHVLVLDERDCIEAILPQDLVDSGGVEKYRGYFMPGFVNTHCHLELSHMHEMIPTGTGLIPFIGDVVTRRNAEAEVIQEATVRQDEAMYQAGIMAVGDISNTTDSFFAKAQSKIQYYTFVESFDLMQKKDTDAAFSQSTDVFEKAQGRKAIVPHAPYSCTPELIQKINEFNRDSKQTISIHNQETIHENNFFLNKTGALVDFYKNFGLSVEDFDAIEKTSIHYLLQHIDLEQTYLFVHNTLTTEADHRAAYEGLRNLYWATCPNANLYIENALPDYRMFMNMHANMTIGTDSLASNWQLSVWDEMVTIKKYNSYLPTELILKWGTINGARALQMDKELGSIEVGKRPGIVHLDTDRPLAELIHSSVEMSRVV